MQGPLTESYSQIVINGVGLLGGSIAAAIRRRFASCRIVGIGRSGSRLQAAQDAGLLDEWATSLQPSHVSGHTIAVVCLPVDMIAGAVLEAARLADDEVLITDVGSVKSYICDEVARDLTAAKYFVGAHPIAGSERGGFEHADAELFEGRQCVVTETAAGEQKLARTIGFWQSLGCRVTQMTAAQHDLILARTSHLPHLLAAVGAACVSEEHLAFTGTGFRDTTRVAAGSPSLWQSILWCNRHEVLASIRQAEAQLAELRSALQESDSATLKGLLQAAADRRNQLNDES